MSAVLAAAVAPAPAAAADGRVVTAKPRAGWILGCSPVRAGASALKAHCVSRRLPVATAIDGRPFLPPFDDFGRDLGARAKQDKCGRTRAGEYIRGAPCLERGRSKRLHSLRIGTARDGYGLYGPRGVRGRLLTNRDLDACHGHRHRLGAKSAYHYHVTREFPYTIGCFRGVPKRPAAPKPAPPAPETAVAPRAQAATGVLADPALFPAFDPGVSDYAVRCVAGTPVRLWTTGPATVEVDGGAPVAGQSISLTAGQGFSFVVDTGAARSVHHARCLPADFPQTTVQRSGVPESEFVIVTTLDAQHPYAIVFDTHGVPIWWMRPPQQVIDAKLLSTGNIAWARFDLLVDDPRNGFEVRGLDGRLVSEHRTVGMATDVHDFVEVPNGDTLLLSYRPRDGVDLRPYVANGAPDLADATVLDAEIQQVRPDGSVAWRWNSADHLSFDETLFWGPAYPLSDSRFAQDPVHINSVELDGDGLIISTRHTNAVYRIDRATGEVDWKLGGTATPDRLAVVGDPFGVAPFSAQHDARVLPDGTLTLHDNGTFASGRKPRAVRYRLDPAAGTATLLEALTGSDVPPSQCCGSARRLPGGSWLIGWGGLPRITEGKPGMAPTFELTWDAGGFSYRAVPVLPGVLSRASLRAGMDAM